MGIQKQKLVFPFLYCFSQIDFILLHESCFCIKNVRDRSVFILELVTGNEIKCGYSYFFHLHVFVIKFFFFLSVSEYNTEV